MDMAKLIWPSNRASVPKPCAFYGYNYTHIIWTSPTLQRRNFQFRFDLFMFPTFHKLSAITVKPIWHNMVSLNEKHTLR